MSIPNQTRTVFDVITDFLAPQEISDYALPEDLQACADYLAEWNGDGLLTYDEERER